MIVLESGDALKGDASAADVVDYTLYGYLGTLKKQLADGQLDSTAAEIYAPSGSTDTITTIILVNTDASARTINLYVLPSGGTARRIIPKDKSLAAGSSLHTDGESITVLAAA